MACKCKVMAKVLEKLGAKHAAKMHKNLDAEWTVKDWLLHFLDEEEFVLPYLPREIADRIMFEHEMMRAQIKIYGRIVNTKLLDDHARFEDDVVIKHLGHLVDAA